MKKFLFTTILAALTLCLTSCPGDTGGDDIDPADLIGTWRLTHIYYIEKENGRVVDEDTETAPQQFKTLLIFETGGTYTIEWYDEGELDDEVSGTWKLTGNIVEIDEGETGSYTIEKLNSTSFVYSESFHDEEDGVKYDYYDRYTFVKEN